MNELDEIRKADSKARRKQWLKAYYQTPAYKEKEKEKHNRQSNKARKARYMKDYHEINKQTISQNQKEYDATHKEEKKANNAEYYKKYMDRIIDDEGNTNRDRINKLKRDSRKTNIITETLNVCVSGKGKYEKD